MFLDTYLARPVQLTHHTWLEKIQQVFANLLSTVLFIHFGNCSLCTTHIKYFGMLTTGNRNIFQLSTSSYQKSNSFLCVHMNLIYHKNMCSNY